MESSQTEVLVVGAGPSGLSAALLLASRGRRVTVIDKNSQRSQQSKAIGVQAGTLELFERVFDADLSQEMIAAGIPARGANIHLDNGFDFFVSLDRIPSKYNYILMLAQHETERILEQRLARFGVHILRNHELVGLSQSTSGVSAEVARITTPTGGGDHLLTPKADMEIEAHFAIGCDGAHSMVRRMVGLEFQGNAYTGHFVLSDLHVDWNYAYEQVHTFISGQGAALFFPLHEKHRYRLILIPRSTHTIDSDGEMTLEFIRRESASFLPPGISFYEPIWMTRFRVSHRLTEHMRVGRVFLCGDAAHIHSPVGAQGMNTGIHDALDIADRLDRVLRQSSGQVLSGWADDLLQGYDEERHANAASVVRYTDFAFRVVLAPENFISRMARRRLLPKILTQKRLQKAIMRIISEVDVARRLAERISSSF
jgi:2-polyprenyl-6-methoxyphenol hydroxylase-like FAD-dependent oxidoreductase